MSLIHLASVVPRVVLTDPADNQPVSKDTISDLEPVSMDTKSGPNAVSKDTKSELKVVSKDTKSSEFPVSKDTQTAENAVSKDTIRVAYQREFRKKRYKTVSLDMRPEEVERFKEYADGLKLSMTEFMRRAANAYIVSMDTPK